MSSIHVTSFKAQALPTFLEPAANGPGRVMPTHGVKPLGTPHLVAHAPPEEGHGCLPPGVQLRSELLSKLLSHGPYF